MQKGDKVYFKVLENYVNDLSGTILEDLGDNMLLVENNKIKMYIKKDRVTKDLKELFKVFFD